MKQTEFFNTEHKIVKDRLDYLDDKVINIEYKTIDTATKVAQVFHDFGISTEAATCSINQLSDALAELGRRIAATEGQIKSLEEKNEELDYLRPGSVIKTENPNQKDDLEFSNRIVPDCERIIYRDILGIECSEDNMFI